MNFVQPGISSVVLNRVTGNEQSVIAGMLTATGRGLHRQLGRRAVPGRFAGECRSAGRQARRGLAIPTSMPATTCSPPATALVRSPPTVTSPSPMAGSSLWGAGNGVNFGGTITARGGKAVLSAGNTMTLESGYCQQCPGWIFRRQSYRHCECRRRRQCLGHGGGIDGLWKQRAPASMCPA